MKDYHSRLDEKIQKNRDSDYSIIENLTVWTDLLGFGNMFSEKNWNINKSDWDIIGARLKSFYEQHYTNIDSREYIFILNDGLVRTFPLLEYTENFFPFGGNKEVTPLYDISLWIRSIVYSHINVNKLDKIGARTVLTYGQRFEKSFLHEIVFEDLIWNYTKKDGKNSSYPDIVKNRKILDNPTPLQMNTALSKSYLLEGLGSKSGLIGSHLYIDESFFIYVKEFAQKSKYLKVIDNEELFAIEIKEIKDDDRRWIMGFKINEKINIDEKIIKTNVYRIEKFYPHDENPDEFHFKLY